jgi:catechol 2,3-dioxygenase-like lactoylglutathione lyase family enzyme
MSRVQLALNVTGLDAAVAFYSRLFGTEPARLRPGYASFAIADPPLKLVLNAPGNGPSGTINHLGVEVDSTNEVNSAGDRSAAEGLDTQPAPSTKCCYALQDKVWAHDPDGLPWEYYTVLEHIETP